MNSLRQCFQNEDLEKKFQKQIQKQAIKSFVRYQIIMTIVLALLMIGQTIKQNMIMIIWFGLLITIMIIALVALYKWPGFNKNIKLYYQSLEIGVATLQIFYYKFQFLNVEQNDMNIYFDIIMQVFTIAHIRFNYINSSFIFIYFISTRVYIQISNEFSVASLAYILTGSYFIIDSYQQEKVKRKLFLKSQRNKQFELLIKEFIDDVIILEKDEENVQLKPKVLNVKLPQICDQFNIFFKNALIPQYKTKLQDYLYKSMQLNETLLCSYKNQTYQITYKIFILKKQQIFLKIKQLDQQMKQLVNYKDLCNYIFKNLIFKPDEKYTGKNIMKSLQFLAFYFQFTRYFSHYRIQIQKINYKYLKYLFDNCRMSVIIENNNNVQFYSDKKLLYLLINIISIIITDKAILIQFKKQMIRIQFNALLNVKDSYLMEINKILYHIGYGQIDERQQSIDKQRWLSLILIDKEGFERFQ